MYIDALSMNAWGAVILEIPIPPNLTEQCMPHFFKNELTRAGTPSARGTAETLEDGAKFCRG